MSGRARSGAAILERVFGCNVGSWWAAACASLVDCAYSNSVRYRCDVNIVLNRDGLSSFPVCRVGAVLYRTPFTPQWYSSGSVASSVAFAWLPGTSAHLLRLLTAHYSPAPEHAQSPITALTGFLFVLAIRSLPRRCPEGLS